MRIELIGGVLQAKGPEMLFGGEIIEDAQPGNIGKVIEIEGVAGVSVMVDGKSPGQEESLLEGRQNAVDILDG